MNIKARRIVKHEMLLNKEELGHVERCVKVVHVLFTESKKASTQSALSNLLDALEEIIDCGGVSETIVEE